MRRDTHISRDMCAGHTILGKTLITMTMVIDVVNLRMLLASLVYKKQFYIWFLGGIWCG